MLQENLEGFSDKDKKQIKQIKHTLDEEPQEFPIFETPLTKLIRWQVGNKKLNFPYTLEIGNVSIGLEQETFDDLDKNFKSAKENRNIIFAIIFGTLIGEHKELNYIEFSRKFKILASFYLIHPEMTKEDEKFFKIINDIHHEFLNNVLDLVSDKDFQTFPEFMKLELLEIAKYISEEIKEENKKEKDIEKKNSS